MKYINSWNDLQHFGINALTGEACRYSQRVLCDLNATGKLLMEEYLGLPKNTIFAANWNSTVNGFPAIASIMLHRRTFSALCEFITYHVCKAYGYFDLQDEGRFIIAETSEEHEAYRELLKFYEGKIKVGMSPLMWAADNQPTEGSRNIHAFTGRAL
jgi:hypothetical protein